LVKIDYRMVTKDTFTSAAHLFNPFVMHDGIVLRPWRALADWWSFQVGTIEGWLDRTPETPEDRAIREEGERLRKAFPSIDLDHPGARKTPPEPH